MEHTDATNDRAFEKAAELLGKPLELPLGRGEPGSGDDFRRPRRRVPASHNHSSAGITDSDKRAQERPLIGL
jgi:hypothetical protein